MVQMESIIGEHWELAGLAENPLGDLNFEDLSATSRAEILYAVCLYRLDNDYELQDYAKIMAEGGPITAIQGKSFGLPARFDKTQLLEESALIACAHFNLFVRSNEGQGPPRRYAYT